jgi:putative transposase
MRYADGGGLTAAERARRERVRFEAAEMYEQGVAPPEVAKRLRVSRKSAYAWHAAWRDGGREALASKGAQGLPCRLSPGQLARLEKELERGPAAHGWIEDQRWTLARIAQLIEKLFRVRYRSLRGVSYLLHRMGWSLQVPLHRAAERDEEAIASWRKETWPRVGRPRGTRARGSSSRTSPASR